MFDERRGDLARQDVVLRGCWKRSRRLVFHFLPIENGMERLLELLFITHREIKVVLRFIIFSVNIFY
jgi:hypothetical protein